MEYTLVEYKLPRNPDIDFHQLYYLRLNHNHEYSELRPHRDHSRVYRVHSREGWPDPSNKNTQLHQEYYRIDPIDSDLNNHHRPYVDQGD